ncbi:transposase, partial [Klebsiella pneumoniae]
DAHNWLLPVAYAVLEGESNESWTWFMHRLQEVIGHPKGLVIHTGACKGLENAVDAVFPGFEHRECMRHLATNFTKKFKGEIFEEDLWRSAYTYTPSTHATYLQNM